MSKRKSGGTRREYTEEVVESKTAMDEKEKDLRLHASDLEQEQKTLDSLELNGAEEDVRQVEEGIERAEAISEDNYESENRELEQIRDNNEVLENDFREGAESAEGDSIKISETKLDGKDAIEALLKAKEAAIAGRDFLHDQAEQTRNAREANEKAIALLDSIVNSIRGKR